MEIFAHAGITLGAATVVANVANHKTALFDALTKYVDIRWLLVGSLLPDIIDKPVGLYLLANGRVICHTLVFVILLTGIGFYLLRKHQQRWMLALAAGGFMHLILDSMWNVPATLFWPLLGFSFPQEEVTGWWGNLWVNYFKPPTFIPEIIGFSILIILLWLLIKRKKVLAFIVRGKIS